MLKLVSNEPKLDFDDVLLVPCRTTAASRKEVELERPFKFYHSVRQWRGFPIMAANMYATGSIQMGLTLAKKFGAVTCLHKFHNNESLEAIVDLDDFIWLSIGLKNREILDKFVDTYGILPNLCIDVANGYTNTFVKFCKEIRNDYPHAIIMAGNVCTPEMTQELIINGGVDIVKIGIGPGSACTTRLKTGVGYPQLSAIAECASVAHGLKSGDGKMGLVCADGGCRTPADVCKAYAANADFVMLGGMLAGTDECDGDWKYERDSSCFGLGDFEKATRRVTETTYKKKELVFYGMSSKTAQEKHGGGMESYKTSEGRIVTVPYKGPVQDVIEDIAGGIRSSCAYIGATSIKDMAKCARFVRVNNTHNRIFE